MDGACQHSKGIVAIDDCGMGGKSAKTGISRYWTKIPRCAWAVPFYIKDYGADNMRICNKCHS